MALWTPKLFFVYILLLLTTSLGAVAQYPRRPRAPGVAFRLTPDYGIASIYLKDGTSVSVAQVQGSPGYQAFMRRDNASVITENSMLCRLLSPVIKGLPPAFGFNVDICRDTDVTNAKALMSILKTAVESYLGTNICFAALSLDNAKGYEAIVAQETFQALGLRQVLPTVRAAGSVVRTHMPNTLPGLDDEPWVVLAVDYSSRWFNVGLCTIDEIGSVWPIESTVKSPRIGERNQLNALRDTLRQLFADPPPDVILPQQIHHVVVYGDAVKDDVLDLLRAVLGVDLVRNAYISNSVFDGVADIAHSVYEVMDTVEFEMRVSSAFGCQWRSKLYREDRVEL